MAKVQAGLAPRPAGGRGADAIHGNRRRPRRGRVIRFVETVRRRDCRVICLPSTRARPRRVRFCSTNRWPPVGFAQLEFPQIYPQPGWVEHDPQGIWTTAVATARAAMASADVTAENVAAIGITNQRETTILWDRATGKPIHNAIVWQDRRTHDACAALMRAGHERLVNERTGLLLDPYFSATKIAWILDQCRRRARAAAEAGRLAFGTVDTYLLWQLTGGKVHADRRHQRGAHAAARYPHRRNGTPSCSRCSASRHR